MEANNKVILAALEYLEAPSEQGKEHLKRQIESAAKIYGANLKKEKPKEKAKRDLFKCLIAFVRNDNGAPNTLPDLYNSL